LSKDWGAATRALERADAARMNSTGSAVRDDRVRDMARRRTGCGARPNDSGIKPRRPESAWKRSKLAFEFFTPEGPLERPGPKPRRWSAAMLPHLSGAAWAKTRRLLLRRESFTFLDQVSVRLPS